jgi:lipopolysaccharide/colanic/teichoic acid biosynthesis glycosyltransferase
MIERLFAIFLVLIFSPLLLIISLFVFVISGSPIFFKQKRLGKNKKVFFIYKFRTMKRNAEKSKKTLSSLNEADGPVFKIQDDPRYTNIGKILSRLGLDELPQLINIIKGDMSFVGPRPLPIKEALHIPQKYQLRFSVLPGVTSLWVINGGHSLSFKKWMELDSNYIKNRSMWLYWNIISRTILVFFSVIGTSFHSYLKRQGSMLFFTK